MTKANNNVWKISIFILLYYIYLSPLRKVFIPGGSITIVFLLLFVSVIIILNQKFTIRVGSCLEEQLMSYSWILILFFIFINNVDLINSLIHGGVVQLFTMVLLLLFVPQKKNNDWIKFFINISIFFIMVHALATIVFYYNSSLYFTYARFVFSGETLDVAIKNYRQGYMAGFYDHFSSNGMNLGIGCIYLFFTWWKTKRNFKLKVFLLIMLTLCAYALILSSKRAPFIAATVMIFLVYSFINKRHLLKSFAILIPIALFVMLLLVFFPDIPGLDTLMKKSAMLENSSAGILNGRNGLWNIAIEMFKQNPLFGMGYGSYSSVSSNANAITTSAHNYYLQVAAELGVVGLLLYFSAFVFPLVLTLRKIVESMKQKNYQNVYYLAISLSIQGFVILYNLSATAMMYYNILIPYFISCMISKACLVPNRRKVILKNESWHFNVYRYN